VVESSPLPVPQPSGGWGVFLDRRAGQLAEGDDAPDVFRADVVDRVPKALQAAGLSQKDLAKRVALTVRQSSRLETGAQTPTWPTVVALAEALGTDCRAFLEAPAATPEPSGAPPRRPPRTTPGRHGDRGPGRRRGREAGQGHNRPCARFRLPAGPRRGTMQRTEGGRADGASPRSSTSRTCPGSCPPGPGG